MQMEPDSKSVFDFSPVIQYHQYPFTQQPNGLLMRFGWKIGEGVKEVAQRVANLSQEGRPWHSEIPRVCSTCQAG